MYASFNLPLNQSALNLLLVNMASSNSPSGFISSPLINLKAFHILLEKLRPCSTWLSSNKISLPAGELSNIPIRTPSAPYWAIRSSGSGELPNDLLIFLRCLSRTIPV